MAIPEQMAAPHSQQFPPQLLTPPTSYPVFKSHVVIQYAPLRTLLEKLRIRLPQTYAHSVRVELYAGMFGLHFGKDLALMRLAGLMHDIGKLRINKKLLEKRGRFNREDHDQVKPHVLYGYHMLLDAGEYWLAEVELRHHRYGCDPYPDPLPEPVIRFSTEEMREIEDCARILALADYYDALGRRDYRFGKLLDPKEKIARYVRDNWDQRLRIRKLRAARLIAF